MKLKGKVLEIGLLSDVQKDRMFELMSAYYDNVFKDKFNKDLNEKQWSIILEDNDARQIWGFSTFMLMDVIVDGMPISGVFSGDTIIDKKYWGQRELSRVWGKFIFSLMEQRRGRKLYWFLASMGYKTYRFLPVFMREFYPRYDKTTPLVEQKILDAFALEKYPLEYRKDAGVLHFNYKKESLKQGIAEITPQRLKDPHIRFFAEKNPGFNKGDELACIAELAEENMKPAMKKIIFSERKENHKDV